MFESRIFILGAGFSAAAGLPLAAGLFQEILQRIRDRYGRDTKFERDIEYYIKYRERCDGVVLKPEEIELEEYMSYLDIEHYLWLLGGDTWSEEGNESQLEVRKYIGQIIHEKTPAADSLPPCYYEFASNLTENDTVITFNYDVVLERALDHINKPYRLFPYRFKNESAGVIDSDDDDEVTILKMHGSLDWFSNKSFLEADEIWKKIGASGVPHDPIFSNPRTYIPYPLADGPRNPEDSLNYLHRLGNLDTFYSRWKPPASPTILSPSYNKIVYTSIVQDFWNGLGKAGGWNTGVSIIGFSLPKHDEYIRLGLYQISRNYQNVDWDMNLSGAIKDNLKVIDLRKTYREKRALKSRYSFLDKNKTEWKFDGFNSEAVKFLFTKSRYSGSPSSSSFGKLIDYFANRGPLKKIIQRIK